MGCGCQRHSIRLHQQGRPRVAESGTATLSNDEAVPTLNLTEGTVNASALYIWYVGKEGQTRSKSKSLIASLVVVFLNAAFYDLPGLCKSLGREYAFPPKQSMPSIWMKC